MIQNILGAILSVFTSLSGTPGVTYVAPLQQSCLDTITAQGIAPHQQSVPAALLNVRKPQTADFIPGQGWDLPQCAGIGSCPQPEEESNYVLVAENVQVSPLIFRNAFTHELSPSDRQLIRYSPDATVSSDPNTQETVKGKLFRTSCGDWCALNIPYRGSFHCDFLFLLQNRTESGSPQIDAAGNLVSPNPVDTNLPQDGSYFSVYFRQGAVIPDLVSCNPKPTVPVEDEAWHRRLLEVDRARAQESPSAFQWPPGSGNEWSLAREGEIKNMEVNPDVVPLRDPQSGASTVVNPGSYMGEYDVYKNLSYPTSETVLYLVPKGTFAAAMDVLSRPPPPQPPYPTPSVFYSPVIFPIPFLEYGPMNTKRFYDAKSLQLGTFELPKTVTWIKKWYEESKPAIYLYPEQDMVLSVRLNPAGHLTVSDPPYDPQTGWQYVVAHPNGTLDYRIFNHESGIMEIKTYPYLYYEAALTAFPIPEEGFIVEGKNLRTFFADMLARVGLNETETADFIEYWMGRLSQSQPYYFIHFLDTATIERVEPITISHQPDTQIRIRPYFKPLAAPISVRSQSLPIPPLRRGFTLVEWGGILDSQ